MTILIDFQSKLSCATILVPTAFLLIIYVKTVSQSD